MSMSVWIHEFYNSKVCVSLWVFRKAAPEMEERRRMTQSFLTLSAKVSPNQSTSCDSKCLTPFVLTLSLNIYLSPVFCLIGIIFLLEVWSGGDLAWAVSVFSSCSSFVFKHHSVSLIVLTDVSPCEDHMLCRSNTWQEQQRRVKGGLLSVYGLNLSALLLSVWSAAARALSSLKKRKAFVLAIVR